MKAIELKERSNYFIKEGNESKQVTFVGMCGNSYRFFWMENGLEVYFQCDVDFIEKHIQAKQTVFVNWEIAHENTDLSDYMEASGVEDILQWFEGDPDQLRINGETVSFIDIPASPNIEVVVYLDGSYSVDENEIVKRLTEFYSGKCVSIESTSDNMKSMQNGICYRGGKGYTYSLYQFPN